MSNSKKVAFYTRVSTKHQDTPEGSLKSQVQRLEEWRKYQNLIEEPSVSGLQDKNMLKNENLPLLL